MDGGANPAVAARVVRLGRTIAVRLAHVGAEKQPLRIVDHVLDDPQAMIGAACNATFYVPQHTHYPGINAPLPEAYCHTVVTALRGPIEAAFGLARNIELRYFGFFALATTSAEDAQPIQKIPHHDSPDPDRLAMVHYLCRGSFGGTGFFRHRATGFESVDRSRHEAYVASATQELAAPGGSAPIYAGADMANYDLVGRADAVFNRLIVYRSHVLHSALLDAATGSTDPSRGRLTANGFIEAMRPR
ncbi:MAG TPA: DUF6445 family protein [Povalibacter sp.]|nr:DUF6445 family protein [Povalibacter sp.]